MGELLEIKSDFLEYLTCMLQDIVEDRWPARDMTDTAIRYARVLGVSDSDIESMELLVTL